jgi:hypothetical protein
VDSTPRTENEISEKKEERSPDIVKTKIVAAVAVGILLLAGPASADIDFVLELNPFSFLHSPDVDEFIAPDFVVMEEIDGSVSLYPSIKVGLGLASERVILDLLAGAGYLWNDAFYARSIGADAVLRVKLDRRGIFTLGPHIGIMRFDPEWDAAADISLKDETGWVAGLGLTVGSSRIAFSTTVDYLSADFEVVPGPGWATSSRLLDISGIYIQLGVQFRF